VLDAGTAEGRVSGLHRGDGVVASADEAVGRTADVVEGEQSVDMADGRADGAGQVDGGALVGRGAGTGSMASDTPRTALGDSPWRCASTRHNSAVFTTETTLLFSSRKQSDKTWKHGADDGWTFSEHASNQQHL
jgi:hypothetical protein